MRTLSECAPRGLIVNSYRQVRRYALFPPGSEITARSVLLLLFIFALNLITTIAQVYGAHTEPAMQCADTSKHDVGDVVVANTCEFNITIQASTPGETQKLKTLDPGTSASIAGSAHDPWRVFACAWPGIPKDQVSGNEVTYASVKYECDEPAVSSPTEPAPSQAAEQVKTEETKFYADAHPYMDEPLPQLKKTVHELGGLKPAASQTPLPDLLSKVAAKADELLRKVPALVDVIAGHVRHAVRSGRLPGQAHLAVARGRGRSAGAPGTVRGAAEPRPRARCAARYVDRICREVIGGAVAQAGHRIAGAADQGLIDRARGLAARASAQVDVVSADRRAAVGEVAASRTGAPGRRPRPPSARSAVPGRAPGPAGRSRPRRARRRLTAQPPPCAVHCSPLRRLPLYRFPPAPPARPPRRPGRSGEQIRPAPRGRGARRPGAKPRRHPWPGETFHETPAAWHPAA